MVVPHGTRDALAELVEVAHSGVAPFIQHAGLAAVRDEATPCTFRRFCARGRELLGEALSGLNGIRYTAPDGAFYGFVRIEGLTDSVALARQLVLEHGVAVAPGVAFGASGEGHLRICFAQSEAKLQRAMDRLRSGLRSLG
jgi:aspartate aminotransferase